MKFIVQKIPSRSVDHLKYEIGDDLIVVEDRVRDAVGCYIRCCEAAGEAAFVRLEDDIELTGDFVSKLMRAVDALGPDQIISFFTLRKNLQAPKKFPGIQFCMFQCVYFPPGLAPKMIAYYRKGDWPKREKNPNDPDSFVSNFLQAEKLSYWIWTPNLVQHQAVVSAIDPRRSKHRQSTSFSK